jgi:anti-sigma B factor antagonist
MDGLGHEAPRTTIEASAVGATLVTIAGELDLATVPGVERELGPLVQSPPERVVFDLSGVSFMDSSGIAMLLRVVEKVDSVKVRDPSVPVQMVLRATGLSEVLGTES